MAASWNGMTGKDDAAAGGDPGGTDGNTAASPPGEDPDQSGAGQTGSALAPRGDQAGPVAAAPVVKYEFPVEISLVGELDDATVVRVAELVFAKLDRELSSRL